MPETAASRGDGLIGPNAILQLAPVLAAAGGPALLDRVMARAGLSGLPDGSCMIPEDHAARAHAAMRAVLPDQAPDLAAQAGRLTADYILAHRIPIPAQRLLRVMPPFLAAQFLSRAIAKHSWTFAGSGLFSMEGAWRFVIADNPLVRGQSSSCPMCSWHSAVFTRLYQVLVAPDCQCSEICCAAQPGISRCVFALRRTGGRAALQDGSEGASTGVTG